jgi:hypothetical protein
VGSSPGLWTACLVQTCECDLAVTLLLRVKSLLLRGDRNTWRPEGYSKRSLVLYCPSYISDVKFFLLLMVELFVSILKLLKNR